MSNLEEIATEAQRIKLQAPFGIVEANEHIQKLAALVERLADELRAEKRQ